jgi:hypothetical protein
MRPATIALPSAALPLLLWMLPAGAAVHVSPSEPAVTPATKTLHHVYDFDYSSGNIDVFAVSGTGAKLINKITPIAPSAGSASGIGTYGGLAFTAITSSGTAPCAACVIGFTASGKAAVTLNAPTISGAPGAPELTDLAVDGKGDVFVADSGQEAAYYFPRTTSGYGSAVVVESGNYSASVAVTPNAKSLYIQGNCGFGEARVYSLQASGGYSAGTCFGISEVALIGMTVDNQGYIFAPVDGISGVFSVGSPSGHGGLFQIPNQKDGVASVAVSHDGSVAFVADGTNQDIYAYAKPPGGWASGKNPTLLNTYTGFSGLNIIAVPF